MAGYFDLKQIKQAVKKNYPENTENSYIIDNTDR